MSGQLVWRCHLCGDERPDDRISVLSRVHPIKDAGGATYSENIRYCNDRTSCISKAQTFSFLEQVEDDLASRPSLKKRVLQRWFGE